MTTVNKTLVSFQIGNNSAFYFCGPVSLAKIDTAPKDYYLEDLTDKEVLGLTRAVNSKVIVCTAGLEDLTSRAIALTHTKSVKRLDPTGVTKVAPTVEEATPVETPAPAPVTPKSKGKATSSTVDPTPVVTPAPVVETPEVVAPVDTPTETPSK